MSISSRITEIREAKGLSKADVAKMLDMDYSNYHRIEGRDSKMTVEQLENIASALGVSSSELLGHPKQQSDLSKRVRDLETTLKDKQALVKLYSEKLDRAESQLLHALYEMMTDKIVELGLQYEGPDLDPMPDLIKEYGEGYHTTEYFFWVPEKDKIKAALELFKESSEASLIMETGLISDPIYLKAYRAYERVTFKKQRSVFNGPLAPDS